MNSKQIVAAVSVVVLLIILIYPALSTGAVSISIRSQRLQQAEHVYLTIDSIWVHETGQSNSTGWKLLSNQSQSVDLVSLQDSTKLLATEHVSAANYDGLRIQISNVTWVFNKTTSTLPPTSPTLDANLEFTVGAGTNVPIIATLTGHQESVDSSKLFAASLNATLTGGP